MKEKPNNGDELQPYNAENGEYLSKNSKSYLDSRREVGSNVITLIKLNDGNVAKVLDNVLKNANISFSKHCLDERMLERNIQTIDIIDCIMNEPLKISEVQYKEPSNLPSYERIGTNVTLVINPETNVIITIYPTKYKLYKKIKGARTKMNKKLQMLEDDTLELIKALLPIGEIDDLEMIKDENFDELFDKIFNELILNEAAQSSLLEANSDEYNDELLRKVSLAVNDIVSQKWWNN